MEVPTKANGLNRKPHTPIKGQRSQQQAFLQHLLSDSSRAQGYCKLACRGEHSPPSASLRRSLQSRLLRRRLGFLSFGSQAHFGSQACFGTTADLGYLPRGPEHMLPLSWQTPGVGCLLTAKTCCPHAATLVESFFGCPSEDRIKTLLQPTPQRGQEP